MKLLYFAWVRTRVGFGEETVDPPASNVVPPSGNVTIWFTASPPAAAGTYEGVIRVTPAGLPAFDVRVQVFRGS